MTPWKRYKYSMVFNLLKGKAKRAITRCLNSSSLISLNPVRSYILAKIISGPTVLMLALPRASNTCSTTVSFSEINNFD